MAAPLPPLSFAQRRAFARELDRLVAMLAQVAGLERAYQEAPPRPPS
jgi:hypothetical protein